MAINPWAGGSPEFNPLEKWETFFPEDDRDGDGAVIKRIRVTGGHLYRLDEKHANIVFVPDK